MKFEIQEFLKRNKFFREHFEIENFHFLLTILSMKIVQV